MENDFLPFTVMLNLRLLLFFNDNLFFSGDLPLIAMDCIVAFSFRRRKVIRYFKLCLRKSIYLSLILSSQVDGWVAMGRRGICWAGTRSAVENGHWIDNSHRGRDYNWCSVTVWEMWNWKPPRVLKRLAISFPPAKKTKS